MAASGLNSEIDIDDEDTDLKTRWAHLADLTHFALELKETLDNINKESFNNFVLKIGAYHGFLVYKDVWKNETLCLLLNDGYVHCNLQFFL